MSPPHRWLRHLLLSPSGSMDCKDSHSNLAVTATKYRQPVLQQRYERPRGHLKLKCQRLALFAYVEMTGRWLCLLGSSAGVLRGRWRAFETLQEQGGLTNRLPPDAPQSVFVFFPILASFSCCERSENATLSAGLLRFSPQSLQQADPQAGLPDFGRSHPQERLVALLVEQLTRSGPRLPCRVQPGRSCAQAASAVGSYQAGSQHMASWSLIISCSSRPCSCGILGEAAKLRSHSILLAQIHIRTERRGCTRQGLCLKVRSQLSGLSE